MEQSLPLEGKVARREIAVTDEVEILYFCRNLATSSVSLRSTASPQGEAFQSATKRPDKLEFENLSPRRSHRLRFFL